MALGGAATALKGDSWSLFHNPSLAGASGSGGGVWYSPAPYGLGELSAGAASFALATDLANVTAGVTFSGFSLYRESTVSIGIARRIEERIHAGVAVNYCHLDIRGYGNAGVLAVDAGLAAQIAADVTVAAAVWNLNQPRIGHIVQERLPLSLSLGVAYEAREGITLAADLAGDLEHPVDVRVGLEYRPLACLALRAGASSEPGSFTCGLGLASGGVGIDYALRAHPDLGLTHAVSATLRLSADDTL
ncbi:MAG: hypothetical protein IPP94_03220 [Ignavibacteria bacterium]|nr:hypothetical protein [Ignavibacteria bacterium]